MDIYETVNWAARETSRLSSDNPALHFIGLLQSRGFDVVPLEPAAAEVAPFPSPPPVPLPADVEPAA